MPVPTKLCFLFMKAIKDFCFKEDFREQTSAALLKVPESLMPLFA